PVISGILADQVNLAHAFPNESTNFCQHRLQRTAAMFSAHLRNHAKTARMITAFRNLYVSEMRRREPEAGRVVIGNVSGARVCEGEISVDQVNVGRFSVRRWAFS